MDSKISNLNLVETVTQDDVLPIVNNGETKKVKVLQLINGLATTAYVDGKDALKVDKVTGKGLSTEDYTTTEKNKLAGIAEGAEVNVNADWNATSGDAQILNKPTIPSLSGVELQANKQNSLAVDGTGVKYPTVDAVNAGLAGVNTNAVDRDTVKLSQNINKGQAVYVSSSVGTNIIVSKASNASEATSSKTFGLLETSGVTNDIVNVVTGGLLAGLNTNSAIQGDAVWLGTDGNLIFGLTNKPVAPAHLVYIGIVTRVSATVGEIFVSIQNGFELQEIHNVLINGLANEDFLQYETSSLLWKNKPLTDTLIKSKLPQSAYTILANNTNASAYPTEQVFENITNATYDGAIPTWTGTTAPSGTTQHTYSLSQIGNLVTLTINLSYGVTGSNLTAVTFDLPSTAPTPALPTSVSVAGDVINYGNGMITTTKSIPTSTTSFCALRLKSTSPNVFEIIINRTAASYRYAYATIQYFV